MRVIGLYGKNSREWLLADIACVMSDITSVTLYDTLGAESTEYIIDQSEMKTIFCSANHIVELSKMKSEGKLETLKNLVILDTATLSEVETGENEGLHIFEFQTVISTGKLVNVALPNPTSDSIFTICYTSGTTGFPKGVMLSHASILSQAVGIDQAEIQFRETDTHISYLPLAHIMDRVVSHACLQFGARVGFFGGDILKLKEDLAELKPTLFISVPRLYNRFYDAMMGKVKELTGVKSYLANAGIRAKLEKLEQTSDPTHSVYDALVFNKFKAALGGRVRLLLTASAPISKDVLSFLKIAFQAPIYEAYGQTETGGCSTATNSKDGTSGHVGGPMPQNDIKLVDVPDMNYLVTDTDEEGNLRPRGEICFKGPNNFSGYFKLPEKTAEALDAEGWIHTGDIGIIQANGSLKIVDRKKNIFKLAQGEYIAPDKLENGYVEIDFVKQIFVYGDSLQANLVAIIVPDEVEVKKWTDSEEIKVENFDDFIKTDVFVKELTFRIKEKQKEKKFNGLEIPKKLHCTNVEFTIEDGSLTPSMKLKRDEAKKMYYAEIKAMYGNALLQGEED